MSGNVYVFKVGHYNSSMCREHRACMEPCHVEGKKPLNYISNSDLIFYSVNRLAEFIITYKC